MARKPKAAPVIDTPQAATGAELPLGDDAPAPTRRGRKPKAAAAMPRPAAEAGSATTATNAVALGAASMDGADAPVRARRGRKPGQEADAAAAFLPQADAQQRTEAGADQPEAAAPAEGDALIAETAVLIADAESSDASSSEVDPGSAAAETAPPSPNVDTTARARPAARWNRATDTVQFDWLEIERTASQDGPNQVMAKLLIAARAEGATSRWPL